MTTETTMPKVINSIAEAKAHFSAIVDDASSGKVFVICRAGRPMAVLSQYVPPSRQRRPGTLKGKIRIADDFDELPDGFTEAFE